jgi:uncharacterized membrane protein HdeD (DUF308 family)
VFGFVWILIALVILQFDQASITTVGVLIGAMFLATGVQQFVIAGMVDGVVRWVLVFFGVLLFIERAYVLLVFAGIWALFQGVNDIFRAFQIRALGKAAEEIPTPPPPPAPAL